MSDISFKKPNQTDIIIQKPKTQFLQYGTNYFTKCLSAHLLHTFTVFTR